MGKISQASSKYIIHATIEIDGIVDRPDVIGAIFGQTEGLLGSELELRELQRSGRIGRIEVNVDTKTGKTKGNIIIPSSLDKAETSIVAAALEIIQRIGPCNAKLRTQNIEDVRITKRKFVIDRAKELLKVMMDSVLPDSQELADEVSHSVRVMEIQEYGREKLPAGPAIDESDEVILVEGRADVLNLLKHGIKNGISINGTSVPETIVQLCKEKVITVFVDGDRGGDLIIKELLNVAEIDFVAKAPDGKEVEEITKKEIHKALRSKISAEQIRLDMKEEPQQLRQQIRPGFSRPQQRQQGQPTSASSGQQGQQSQQRSSASGMQRPSSPGSQRPSPSGSQRPQMSRPAPVQQEEVTPEMKEKFENLLDDLIGTRGAYILDDKLSILGKVPFTELASTLEGLNGGVCAIVFDGDVEKEIVANAEKIEVKFLVAMESKVDQKNTRVKIMTPNDF